MKKVLMIAIAIVLAKTASAQTVMEKKPILKGEYYALSRELAERLSLDYDTIISVTKPLPEENVVIKVDNHDQVDISIFDDTQFASARLDFVIQ